MALRQIALVAMVLGVVLAGPGPLGAQALDPASQEALAATLKMLTDPALRGPEIARNQQATAVEKQVQSMMGSEQLREEFYALAAQIFQELTSNSGGDVGKMSEALERAKADPAVFAAMLSPATLQRLREVSIKISDQRR
jgi:hypothetical protein